MHLFTTVYTPNSPNVFSFKRSSLTLDGKKRTSSTPLTLDRSKKKINTAITICNYFIFVSFLLYFMTPVQTVSSMKAGTMPILFTSVSPSQHKHSLNMNQCSWIKLDHKKVHFQTVTCHCFCRTVSQLLAMDFYLGLLSKLTT